MAPETSLASSPGVGGSLGSRLAAVSRSLSWAAADPAHLARSPYLGGSCARLVAVLSAEAPEAVADDLAGLRDGLEALDGLESQPRQEALVTLLTRVRTLVPPSVEGARLAIVEAPGGLLVPRRRRRRDREGEEGEEPESSEGRRGRGRRGRRGREEADDPQAAGAAEAPASAEVAGDGAIPVEAAAPAEDTPAAAGGPLLAPAEAAPAPEPPPPPPPARPLGHPAGTGRSLAALEAGDPGLLEALASLGIETIADLLQTPPVEHVRHRNHPRTDEGDEPVTVRGRVLRRYTLLTPMGRRRTVVLDVHGGAEVTARWLGETAPRGWDTWQADTEIALVGTPSETEDGLVLYESEPVGIDGRGSGFLPVYGLEGCDDSALRDLVALALASIHDQLVDPIPSGILGHHRLLTLDHALRDAHFPANAGGRGRVRLAFEELLLMQLGVAWRAGRGRPERGLSHRVVHHAIGQIGAQHGITLEDGQEIAFAEVRRDLRRSRPMARLLQGDVGAGKGLVCLLSALVVVENGHQVAMISPDALAAERRYLHAEGLLRSVGVAPLLVGERVNHAQADAIRRGEAQIVFGTSAVLEADLGWKRLGLVVVEERGPYGTVTAGSLARGKGPRPDLLVTTRAPIPSSLTFTVFGDLDVSVVRQDHRPRVGTTVLPAEARKDAYAQARRAIEEGRQVFVVLPVRDGRDLLNHADAMRMAAALQSEALAGARVGVYSTDMTREDRNRAFDDFQHRRIDALVCTTYIEDARPVANATVMLVEYADLHDMMRLHRLRAHVGGGHVAGSCFFVLSDQPSAEAVERVERVASEQDGFVLAEQDLEARGATALLGDRAAEMPEFTWAAPPQDRELLLRARQEAFRIVSEDGDLRRAPDLSRAVTARWGDWLGHNLPEPAPRPKPSEDRNRRRRRRRRRR